MPNFHLVFAILLSGLSLIQSLKPAVMTLVQAPNINDWHREIFGVSADTPCCLNWAPQHRCENDVKSAEALCLMACRGTHQATTLQTSQNLQTNLLGGGFTLPLPPPRRSGSLRWKVGCAPGPLKPSKPLNKPTRGRVYPPPTPSQTPRPTQSLFFLASSWLP